jgi:integrase
MLQRNSSNSANFAYHTTLLKHSTPRLRGAKTVPKVLNDAFIRSAPPGVHWDGSLKGFGLRVGSNRKTFIVLVASGRRKKIGVWPHTKLAKARSEAKTLLAEKTLGRTYPTHTAFDDAKTAFFAACEERVKAGTLKPRTLSDYRRLLKRFPFGRQSVADITPRQILQKLDPLPPSERHHAYTAARRFFRYCVQHHLIDRSPMEHTASAPPGRPRTRVLTEDELQAVWRTARAGESHFHRIVALLVLTGQRRGEIAALQWGWIKGKVIEFPASVAKNHRAWTIPIGPKARAIIAGAPRLSERYVFPALRQRQKTTTVFNGWGKPKARFDKECEVIDWTLHDLRRTYSSMHAKLGTPQMVVEKLLNHVSGGTLSPIAAVYNVHRYEAELRKAVLTYERWLTSVSAMPAG